MRTFLHLLMGLFLVTGLVGQQGTVDITLKDGRVLRGQIVSRTQERLILSDGTLEVAVPSGSIASITEVKKAPTPAPETGSGGQQVPPDGQQAAPAAQDPPAAPGGETVPTPEPDVPPPALAPRTPATPMGDGASPGGRLQSRLGWIAERYSWAVPQAGSEAMSMGLLFLIIFTFSIHFGGMFANLEDRSLTRSFTASLFVVIALAAQCAFLPSSPPVILGAVATNLVAWFVMVRVIMGGGFFNATTLMFAVGAFGVVAGILLEVVDYVFVAIENAH